MSIEFVQLAKTKHARMAAVNCAGCRDSEDVVVIHSNRSAAHDSLLQLGVESDVDSILVMGLIEVCNGCFENGSTDGVIAKKFPSELKCDIEVVGGFSWSSEE